MNKHRTSSVVGPFDTYNSPNYSMIKSPSDFERIRMNSLSQARKLKVSNMASRKKHTGKIKVHKI